MSERPTIRPAGGSEAGGQEPVTVAVLIVTHNDAADLDACFATIASQEHRPLEVVVVDCASGDGSAEAARRAGETNALPTTLLPLDENRGFAGGMNEALAHTGARFVLSLNADARPRPDFVSTLLDRLRQRPRAAAATGRLIRLAGPGREGEAPILDACGMRLTLTWRHLDRGSGEPDRGQYAKAEKVFGATGAATLFRRQALDDVAVAGEIFDTSFHSFREDAELAFRFAERGWEVIYEPGAVALHRRTNLPSRRRDMPAEVNFHSLKNRYLLRAYHQTAGNFLLTLFPTLLRDKMAFLYVLLAERSSLSAYRWLWRNRRQVMNKRRLIQARKTRPARELNRWFRQDSRPL